MFRHYFDIHSDVQHHPELMAEALRLRYQVYCVEHAYEDAAGFPDRMERDEYDARSVHSLLIHRGSGLVAGTVRLIRPDATRPFGSLPIDSLCADPRLFDQGLLPRETLAEVSRFAISKQFRRRIEDAPSPTGIGLHWREPDEGGPRRIPHLSLGLAQAMLCASSQHGITHWVAEMEPALLRMFAALGLHWQPLGPTVQLRGCRQPCYVKLVDLLRRARRERPEIWDLVTNGGSCDGSGRAYALSQPVPEPPPRWAASA